MEYVDTLEEYLLPFTENKYNGWWQFQQDGARSHTAHHTKDWFISEGIDVMEWPACSPDINPIENLWSAMVLLVYQGFRQFEDEDDLVDAIMYAWDNITPIYMENLIVLIPSRCLEVLEKRGGLTHY